MPNDTSYTLWLDSGRTVPFTGTLVVDHESDLSDNPVDTVLYLGSNSVTNTQLQTVASPGVNNILITPTDKIDDWEASTAYSLGDLIEPTTPNTYAYRCTTAGTSGGSEPTFPTGAIGDTVVDGGVVWTLIGKRHEVTEVTLANTAPDLDVNAPGAVLSLGTTLTSGNSYEIHIRLINAVTTIQNNTLHAHLGLFINPCKETEV